MRILIHTPAVRDVATGNRGTASRWAEVFRELGHEVTEQTHYDGEDADLLVALHAAKSHNVAAAFRQLHPERRIVVALTGTDVYPEPSAEAIASMQRADRLVGLQDRVRERLPTELRDRLRIILQSARSVQSAGSGTPTAPDPEHFHVAVVGHMRPVKDPLRAAFASRLLPETSRIRIRHAGAILDPIYEELVAREQTENPRYAWLGELERDAAGSLIASCRLFVLSSHHEGGARALGEAIVSGTPVVAARNDATLSALGDDYPALFDAEDTATLASLLHRAETDAAFLGDLRTRTAAHAPRFAPDREVAAWRDLLAGLTTLHSTGGTDAHAG